MEGILAFFDLTTTDAQMILIYCAVFVVFWQGMAKYFWGPYLKLLDRREALTAGAESTAQAQVQEATNLRSEFEQKISGARVEAMQEKLGRVAEASKQSSEIVSAAEQKASEEIASAREELKQTLNSVKEQAFAQTDSMVNDVVDQLKKPLSETRSSLN